jgi:transposase
MSRYIEGEDRHQSTLFPELLDNYISEDNSVRLVDVFVDELDLSTLGFNRSHPKATGRPAYHRAHSLNCTCMVICIRFNPVVD